MAYNPTHWQCQYAVFTDDPRINYLFLTYWLCIQYAVLKLINFIINWMLRNSANCKHGTGNVERVDLAVEVTCCGGHFRPLRFDDLSAILYAIFEFSGFLMVSTAILSFPFFVLIPKFCHHYIGSVASFLFIAATNMLTRVCS
jgi:hypothetical protein